jgi:hypothetical protein
MQISAKIASKIVTVTNSLSNHPIIIILELKESFEDSDLRLDVSTTDVDDHRNGSKIYHKIMVIAYPYTLLSSNKAIF